MVADEAPATPLLVAKGLTKRYGALTVLDGVDVALEPGEIVMLLGENGAGKSTLAAILCGGLAQDEGEVRIGGVMLPPGDAALARTLGAAQAALRDRLFPPLTLVENMLVGNRRGLKALSPLERTETAARIRAVAAEMGFNLDPERLAADLAPTERKEAEIVRALLTDPTVLILDEPGAEIGPIETARLFAPAKRRRDAGAAVVCITHKPADALAFGDRILVLRRGRLVATPKPGEIDAAGLAALVMGRDAKSPTLNAPPPSRTGERTPESVNATPDLPTEPFRFRAAGAFGRIALRPGEIVGLVEIRGAGGDRLMRVLSGLEVDPAIRVEVNGLSIDPTDAAARRSAGIAVVPEDRDRLGAAPTLRLWENAALDRFDQLPFSRCGLLDAARFRNRCRELINRFGVRVPVPTALQPDVPFAALSGGNRQKIALGRALAADPAMLVAALPLRGLDPGAQDRTRAEILALKNRGGAALLYSLDHEEIEAVCDRMLVLAAGRIVAEFRRPIDHEALGRALLGLWTERAA